MSGFNFNNQIHGGTNQVNQGQTVSGTQNVGEQRMQDHIRDFRQLYFDTADQYGGPVEDAPLLMADIEQGLMETEPAKEEEAKRTVLSRLKSLVTDPKMGRAMVKGMSAGLRAAFVSNPVGAGVVAFLDEVSS